MGEGQGAAHARPIEVVAFDFDGTLTTHDSYTAFLRWRAGAIGYALGGLRLLPALAAYPLRRDRGALKEAASRVYLGGVKVAALEADAERFAASQTQGLLRPDALACWQAWGERGVVRAIVTASPKLVVAPFARRLGAQALIGTRLEVQGDRLTGRFASANCRGAEKVARLRAAFGDGVRILAAYGDTAGDREMLATAEAPHYRLFTERP